MWHFRPANLGVVGHLARDGAGAKPFSLTRLRRNQNGFSEDLFQRRVSASLRLRFLRHRRAKRMRNEVGLCCALLKRPHVRGLSFRFHSSRRKDAIVGRSLTAAKNVGLWAVNFLALMARTLLERELRNAMAERRLAALPLYPEGRACRRPTTRHLIDLFEPIQRHSLFTAHGSGRSSSPNSARSSERFWNSYASRRIPSKPKFAAHKFAGNSSGDVSKGRISVP